MSRNDFEQEENRHFFTDHTKYYAFDLFLKTKEGLKQADLNNSKTSPLSPLFGRYFKLLVYLTEMWVKPSVSVFVLSHRGAAVIYDLSAESQKQESAWSLIRTAVSEMKWGINNDILCTPFFFSSTIHDYMVRADDKEAHKICLITKEHVRN